MAKNRKCLLCGHEYKYCGHNCNDKNLPTWYNLFHDENCHEIWNILCDFENGHLTKEEAKIKLNQHDTSVIKESTAIKSYNKIFETQPLAEEAESSEELKIEEGAVISENVVEAETPVEEEPVLSVSEELKKHNNRHNKYNKKN